MSKVVQHIVSLRLAKKKDLLHSPGLLKVNEIYYIKHPKTHLLSGPYVLDAYHNSKKMEEYYAKQCIYVPLVDFDFDITNNLQQKDMKALVAKKEVQKTISQNQN